MTDIGMISSMHPMPSCPARTSGASSATDATPAFSSLLEARATGAASMPASETLEPVGPAPRRPDMDALILQLLACRKMVVTTTSKAGRAVLAAPGQGTAARFCSPAGDAAGGDPMAPTCDEEKLRGAWTGDVPCRLARHRERCIDAWGASPMLECASQAAAVPVAWSTNTVVWTPVANPRMPVQPAYHRVRRQQAPRSRSDHYQRRHPEDVDGGE